MPESCVSILPSFPQASWETKEEGWQRHLTKICLSHCYSKQH